ncbi:MAG: hypothetical protein ACU0CC_03130 [Sagittula sp.]|jgi:osmotically inducible lipoprotein OsmB|uniref:Glycine zipper domain-containing protein n=1 Tax=Sagittula stellata (strain ATCC 700073 / DSM 11524 / E-37) TaxID=388399 RepID=A3JZK9_SAGS3|nr:MULTISPECIES: hypothetical protein [Sagittula]AUC51985.1 hypothetical protein CDO87_01695 [Sagittula sp. P11]EBA09912.1 hypothetical protein SSE37_08888 [Sagittula stellata E-37]WHZ36828.1 hypothetical protein QNI11_07375 [Sagittula sp. MA-2]
MRILTLTAALAATLGLAACEGTDLERGALGAGIGAATAAATNRNVAAGAAIGGAAGVVCDDVTPQLCN